jgi:hypothetical protein
MDQKLSVIYVITIVLLWYFYYNFKIIFYDGVFIVIRMRRVISALY